MSRSSWTIAPLAAALAALALIAGRSTADVVVVGPPPVVAYYPPPAVAYYPPPAVAYYPPPAVAYDPPPAVAYYPPAPVAVTSYSPGYCRAARSSPPATTRRSPRRS